MATVLITGGTGMIGKAITYALIERGYQVIILSRNLQPTHPSKYVRYAHWDIQNSKIEEWVFNDAEYIINLTGASLSEKRWTTKRKKVLVDSRVDSGKLIVHCLKSIPNKVKAVISTSATGWYGGNISSSNYAFTETDPAADDFLGQTCVQWETAIRPVIDLDIRLVTLRIGIVLSDEGGAMSELKKPLRFGIAAIPGSGEQIMSWIHLDDLVRIFLFMLDNENLSGVFNAVSPNPVPIKKLILQLAQNIRGKRFIPIHIPSFVLKIIFGEVSTEILKSFTVSSDKISENGFIFQFDDLKFVFNRYI